MNLQKKDYVLIVLDCENVFKSAQFLFGQNIRVNYTMMTKHLTDYGMEHYGDINFKKLAFNSIKPSQHTQMDFLCALTYLGYDVKSSVSVLDEETYTLKKQENYFTWIETEVMNTCFPSTIPLAVFIVCGSSQLKPLHRKLISFGVSLEVFGFEGSVSTHILGVSKHGFDRTFLLS